MSDKINSSNNDIMWDCMADIFSNNPNFNTINELSKFRISYEKHGGEELEYNFSHDNWTTVFCWFKKFTRKIPEDLPIFGHHTKHPLRFIKFLWMKYKLAAPLRIISLLDMIIRHGLIRRQTGSGSYHTSGLLLDYYIHYSYENKVEMWILTKLMKTMFKDWEEVFSIYHNHPNQYNYKVYQEFLKLDID